MQFVMIFGQAISLVWVSPKNGWRKITSKGHQLEEGKEGDQKQRTHIYTHTYVPTYIHTVISSQVLFTMEVYYTESSIHNS
jgi:hypothetical protein